MDTENENTANEPLEPKNTMDIRGFVRVGLFFVTQNIFNIMLLLLLAGIYLGSLGLIAVLAFDVFAFFCVEAVEKWALGVDEGQK